MRLENSTNPKTSTRVIRDASLSTQRAILDSAELIFARYGLAGTRTEDIASGSGVTKAMIHYYFKTKEALYQAMLDRVFLEREEGMDFVRLKQLKPDEALQEFIKRLLYQMCAKPHIGPLFVHENIQNNGAYYQRGGGKLYPALMEIVERGVVDGIFRNMDPLHGAINIIGTCVHYFTISTNIRNLQRGKLPPDKQFLLEHSIWATDFISNAMAFRPALKRPKLGRQGKPKN
jgi:TetR/AcrR family transcriptional regulator